MLVMYDVSSCSFALFLYMYDISVSYQFAGISPFYELSANFVRVETKVNHHQIGPFTGSVVKSLKQPVAPPLFYARD